MNKTERKGLDFLIARKNLFFMLVITILSIIARMSGREFVSGDASAFLLPWFETIRNNGGIASLGMQVGDYGIPYQFLIAIMTYLPFNPLYTYKFLSCIFDFGISLLGAKFVYDLYGKKSKNLFCLVYSVLLFLPTVILNSSVWAQCDAIYTFFALLTLYSFYHEKFTRAFIFLGAALAFKLQAIFIVPFLLIYYITERKFNLITFSRKSTKICGGNIWITILVFELASLPGFLRGRSLLDPFRIYLYQSGECLEMWLNFPTVWVLLGNNYETLHTIAVLLTITILGIGLFQIINNGLKLSETDNFLYILAWSVWTVLLFLPAMHERYAYPLDIILVIYAFYNHKMFKYAAIAELCSLITYGNFLFGNGIDLKWVSVIYIASYLHYSWKLLNLSNDSIKIKENI